MEPYTVTEVSDRDGAILYQAWPKRQPVLDIAWPILSPMLKGVPSIRQVVYAAGKQAPATPEMLSLLGSPLTSWLQFSLALIPPPRPPLLAVQQQWPLQPGGILPPFIMESRPRRTFPVPLGLKTLSSVQRQGSWQLIYAPTPSQKFLCRGRLPGNTAPFMQGNRLKSAHQPGSPPINIAPAAHG